MSTPRIKKGLKRLLTNHNGGIYPNKSKGHLPRYLEITG